MKFVLKSAKFLRAIKPLSAENLILGQYSKSKAVDGKTQMSYIDEPGVSKGSLSPTYAAAVMYVNNQRWSEIPFLLRAGKGLEQRKTEIRVLFNEIPISIFKHAGHDIPLTQNELVLTVKPQESIQLNIMNKIPGLDLQLANSILDLKSNVDTTGLDAYGRLILDVIGGDQSFFVGTGELSDVWNIFSPALQAIEKQKIKPIQYPFGSRGPVEADLLAQTHGTKWREN